MTLTVLVLAACAPVPIPTSDATPTLPVTPTVLKPTTSTQNPALPTPTLPAGGSIVVGVVGDMTLQVNAMPAFLQNAVFDSLLTVDPTTGALKPGLADAFQVSDDATTMTFHLRPDVRWHNGDPFTAADVVATIKAFSDPNFRGTPVTDFGTLTRATAIDPQTVQLSFSEGYCAALASIGTLSILPRAVVTSANFPRLTPAQMIGTGPLKFRAGTLDRFTLDRNAEYFRGAPPIEAWTLRVFADSASLREAFAAKQIDVMPAAAGEYAAIKNSGANIVATDAPAVIEVLYNVDTPTLNDARVRQALNYALDRNALLNDIGGQARLIDTSMLPGYWANNANLPRYSYDPALARQILADAGWRDNGDGVLRKNGKPMQLELWAEADDPILEPLAFRLRETYGAALGIQVVMELDDRSGWVTRAFQHRFDLLLLTRKIPLDPDQHWYWQSDQNVKGSGFNFGSYTNARVDSNSKDALRVAGCDSAARAALYGDINRTLVTEAPTAFLFAPTQYLVARDVVAGPAPSAFAGDFWNINVWRVKQ
ncbi:MAG: hypothetical protein KGJ80_06495 [Chloroflexota bacterium]|nr:hypothetical protein [Chloroflexota bacterium]